MWNVGGELELWDDVLLAPATGATTAFQICKGCIPCKAHYCLFIICSSQVKFPFFLLHPSFLSSFDVEIKYLVSYR